MQSSFGKGTFDIDYFNYLTSKQNSTRFDNQIKIGNKN